MMRSESASHMSTSPSLPHDAKKSSDSCGGVCGYCVGVDVGGKEGGGGGEVCEVWWGVGV
jgi:hypothetical protein